MSALDDALELDPVNFSITLLESRPDRFINLLDEVKKDATLRSAFRARATASIVLAMRATYVLLVEGGPLPNVDGQPVSFEMGANLVAYRALHIAGVLGHTGRVEVAERTPAVARGLRNAAEDYSLQERVVVHAGNPQTIVSGLNGPYDLVVMNGRWRDYEPMLDDLVRLVRIGGSIVVSNGGALPRMDKEDDEATSLRRFLWRLARDERFLFNVSPAFDNVLAARIR